ncbi:hypothetical protein CHINAEXTREME_04520 [Halobiforma lacisalsi AJ5]|uniref:Uncharacterized protein n=1 Tax=Natronobacterium lacisalsi AJ5 TaxID=358396 RepID=M0LQS3_NATLA|nr:hypothetical protein [Halobiforma lacisalsi]APW97077.1 hypothetical protein CHINAEXTREME_04520 [Halobiforma lacisalsi AJ5]EMA34799.1 hypothetical protein C445_07775 [Halobiforma lacisalsi AJ5]
MKETVDDSGDADTEYRSLTDFGAESDTGEKITLERTDDGEENREGAEYAERQEVIVRPDLKFEEVEDEGTWAAWNTNMDVATRDLRGLAYQYRYRWRVETAIRQLKQDFTGRCGSASPEVRALYFGAGQLFFNFWVALNHELPYRLDHTGIRVTGLEVLHGLREADFEAASAKRWV